MNGNEIIKAALLGTDKYAPLAPVELGETGAKIMAAPTDREDRFLKLAIATLLYEEAGRKPALIEMQVPECPAELLPIINENLSSKIKASLSTKDDVLLHYFIYLTHKRNQVLSADLVPAVLNKALENKKAGGGLVSACGETGKWLCGLNPYWLALTAQQEDENVWETGTFDSRKKYMAGVRQCDPVRAIELLQGSIEKESAANRAALVELLETNLSLNDEPFLEKLLGDKSQKVKEIALGLLQKLQGSSINKRYLDYLLSVILVKEERFLLITKRKALYIRDDGMPDEGIFKTGIDKISSDKNIPDYLYIIKQMLLFINPVILAQRLGVNEEDLLKLFLQHKDAELLCPALAVAAEIFGIRTWAPQFLKNKEIRYFNLIHTLPLKERYEYIDQFIGTHGSEILPCLFDYDYSLMPLALGQRLIDHFSKNPYTNAQAVYQRLALHLPNDIIPHIKPYAESVDTDYQIRYFKTVATEMLRIIDVRNNTN